MCLGVCHACLVRACQAEQFGPNYVANLEARLKAVIDIGIDALSKVIPDWRQFLITKEKLDSIKANVCSEDKLATLSSAYVAVSAIQAEVKDVCERMHLNIAVTHKASMWRVWCVVGGCWWCRLRWRCWR